MYDQQDNTRAEKQEVNQSTELHNALAKVTQRSTSKKQPLIGPREPRFA